MGYRPTKMMIKLTNEESRELGRVAEEKRRDPREQAALFVRQGLGLDGETVRLSAPAAAALAQVAEDKGLSSLDEALEFVVVSGAARVES